MLAMSGTRDIGTDYKYRLDGFGGSPRRLMSGQQIAFTFGQNCQDLVSTDSLAHCSLLLEFTGECHSQDEPPKDVHIVCPCASR